MDERFVSLAAFVRAAARTGAPGAAARGEVPPPTAARGEVPSAAEGPARESEPPRVEPPPAQPPRANFPSAEAPHAEVIQELVLMRLAALEAYERSRLRLLESLAREVLARELMLAPAEIAVLASRALASFADLEPVRVVLAPQDAQRVALALPVRSDPALEPGDLVVEVRDGELESHFAFRARRALGEAAGPA